MKKKEYLKKILIVLSVFVLITVSDLKFKSLIFLIFSVFFNTLVIVYLFKKGIPIDVEFSTFSAVLITLSANVWWGTVTAILTKLFANFFTGNFIIDHFFNILAFSSAAVLAHFFSHINVALLGVAITLVTNLYVFFNCNYVLRMSLWENILYTSTRVIYSLGLFIGFSEVVLVLIS